MLYIEYNIKRNRLSPHILLFIHEKSFIHKYGLLCFLTERSHEEHETKGCNSGEASKKDIAPIRAFPAQIRMPAPFYAIIPLYVKATGLRICP